jgi:tetratricopeptide (TPR) repeat protein
MDTPRLERAVALRDAGRVEEALTEFFAMAESTADSEEKASLLANESACLTILGRLAEARERLSRALQIVPRTEGILYLQYEDALLCSHEGKWDEALCTLDRLRSEHRELLPTAEHAELNEQIQILQGAALRAVGRIQEARATLERCLSFQLGPADEKYVLFNLGACLAYLKENGRAKQTLGEALRRGLSGVDAASAHYHLGIIHYEEKGYAWALQEFESAASGVEQGRIPKSNLYGWLAATARRLGMTDDAERYEKVSKS